MSNVDSNAELISGSVEKMFLSSLSVEAEGKTTDPIIFDDEGEGEGEGGGMR